MAAGCYGDKPLTQVLEVHSVAGADCPTSVAFKGQNLYNFPLPMQPEIREHLLPNLEGFATAYPLQDAPHVPLAWLHLHWKDG